MLGMHAIVFLFYPVTTAKAPFRLIFIFNFLYLAQITLQVYGQDKAFQTTFFTNDLFKEGHSNITHICKSHHPGNKTAMVKKKTNKHNMSVADTKEKAESSEFSLSQLQNKLEPTATNM